MAFYHKLAELVEKHGERAYQAISEAVAQAVGKQYPARYFAKAIIGKLQELG